MPTYDYECEKCGHKFDIFQSMKDEPVKDCPKCKGPVSRLMGIGSGIIFKGTGFYETDYKRKSAGTAGPSVPPCGKGEGCGGCKAGK